MATHRRKSAASAESVSCFRERAEDGAQPPSPQFVPCHSVATGHRNRKRRYHRSGSYDSWLCKLILKPNPWRMNC